MNIVEAIRDPRLLGAVPAFRALESWSSWLVVFKVAYGLPLESEAEHELFTKLTGRQRYAPPLGGWPELVLCTGRQGGKSRAAATIEIDTLY